MSTEQIELLTTIDEKSESGGIVLKLFKYIVAIILLVSSIASTYLQTNMATKFEVLSERLATTNKQLEENKLFVQKLMIDLHAVELAVKELQFNEKIKKEKSK